MIFINWMGLALFASALLLNLHLVISDSPFTRWGRLASGAMLVVLDLLMRRQSEHPRWVYTPAAGGHVSFIPVWVIGIGFFVGGIAIGPPDPRRQLLVEDMRSAPLDAELACAALAVVPGAKATVRIAAKQDACLAVLDLHTKDVAPSARQEAAARVEEQLQTRCNRRWFLFLDNGATVRRSLDGRALGPEETVLAFYD